jgi:hypothetical protein
MTTEELKRWTEDRLATEKAIKELKHLIRGVPRQLVIYTKETHYRPLSIEQAYGTHTEWAQLKALKVLATDLYAKRAASRGHEHYKIAS